MQNCCVPWTPSISVTGPSKLRSKLTSGRSLDGSVPAAGLAQPVAGLAAASFVAFPEGSAESVAVVPRSSPQGGLASMQVVGPKQLLHRKESGSLVEPFPGSMLNPLLNMLDKGRALVASRELGSS